MPRLIRWYVKMAFVWLVLALFLKAISLFPDGASLPAITPVSWHLLFVGWLTQLIFGIAHWMLPTKPGATRKDKLRGNERLMWGIFLILNVGLALRVVAEPMQIVQPNPVGARWLIASAWLQWLAAVGFVANSWGRVRPPVRRYKRQVADVR
jgi:hypothetical protein